MRRIFLYAVAFVLLPLYPLLKKMRRTADKISFGERVIVVMRSGRKKRVLIT